jgi:hypothetical protein
MKYLLLVYFQEEILTDKDRSECYETSGDILEEIKSKGQFVSGAPLYPTSTATSVRVRDGKQLVTDGPFAETREQLGGYYLVDVENLDEAIAIAGRTPGALMGTVEVRPIVEPPASTAT